MEKVKSKSRIEPIQIITVILTAAIVSIGIYFCCLSDKLTTDTRIEMYLIATLLGTAVMVLLSFVKERHLRLAAVPAYLIPIAGIVISIIAGHGYFSARYIFIGDIAVFTPGLLALILLPVAVLLTKYEYNDTIRTAFILCFFILPCALLFLQSNLHDMVICFIFIFTALIYLRAKKFIEFPWQFYVIILIVVAAVTVYLYSNYFYFYDRIQNIVTRGRYMPEAAEVRLALDKVFNNAKILGSSMSTYSPEALIHVPLSLVIAKAGWVAFFAVLSLFSGLMVCVCYMVSRINNSHFRKVLASLLLIYLMMRIAISLFSMFFMDDIGIIMPFFHQNIVSLIMCYASLGIIMRLYSLRHEVVFRQAEEHDYSEDGKLSERMKNALKMPVEFVIDLFTFGLPQLYDDFDMDDTDDSDLDYDDLSEYEMGQDISEKKEEPKKTECGEVQKTEQGPDDNLNAADVPQECDNTSCMIHDGIDIRIE